MLDTVNNAVHNALHVGREALADHACHAADTRGRLVPEPSSPTRTPFQRDRDRIIHSSAFRRLKHKTQVFVYHEGDHFRTRLTHSIEVSQIARALARAFRADEDLAEALALCHDFGHTPFGHTGEDELNRLMADHGGFDHNAQSLRIVTSLEHRYAEFDGLNLSWETLEGLVKHNGPLLNKDARPINEPVPEDILAFDAIWPLDLADYSSIEAQCAAIADDIAYNAHDLDDALRAGLFQLNDLLELPLVGRFIHDIRARYPGLHDSRVTHEVVRRQITVMVEDVIVETLRRLETLNPTSATDIRQAPMAMVAFSEEMAVNERAIKQFLFNNMYRAPSVMKVRRNAETVVRDLYGRYTEDRQAIPDHWFENSSYRRDETDATAHARMVADFIAGMTDRYAILEHNRLFDETPDLR